MSYLSTKINEIFWVLDDRYQKATRKIIYTNKNTRQITALEQF